MILLNWCIFYSCLFCFVVVGSFRSSSIDSVPLVTSSATSPEVADANKDAAIVAEQKVEDSPAPAVIKPLHTSPDLDFAREVTSKGCDLSV